MSDLASMARSTAHVIAADLAAHGAVPTEGHLADAFARGALWAIARATYALAITHAAAGPDPAALRPGIERAQAAIVATHERMRQGAAELPQPEAVAWPTRGT